MLRFMRFVFALTVVVGITCAAQESAPAPSSRTTDQQTSQREQSAAGSTSMANQGNAAQSTEGATGEPSGTTQSSQGASGQQGTSQPPYQPQQQGNTGASGSAGGSTSSMGSGQSTEAGSGEPSIAPVPGVGIPGGPASPSAADLKKALTSLRAAERALRKTGAEENSDTSQALQEVHRAIEHVKQALSSASHK